MDGSIGGVDREGFEKMQVVVLEWDASGFLRSSMLRSLVFSLEAPRLGRWCWWKGGGPFNWPYGGYNVVTESVVAMKKRALA